MKRVLVMLSLMVVSFLAGYIPQMTTNRTLTQTHARNAVDYERNLSDLEEQLAVSALQGQLGLVLLELGQDNFGQARALATPFFDGAAELAFTHRDAEAVDVFRRIGNQRDGITIGLASPTPETRQRLDDLYLELSGLHR
jgi:hypothetical protein